MAAVLEQPAVSAPAALGRLRGFASGAREIDDAPVRVDGRLPDWLRGRLLLNGPALWELPHGRFRHWFDGLAMLHRLHITAAGVRYRSRFARSEAYIKSLAAGTPAFGEFGTPNPASLLARLKGASGTDNPAVVMSRVGERWIAVTETPFLTGFDPDTLATTGRLALDDDANLHLMAAHGFTDRDGTYWNVGTTLGPKCDVKLFRLRPGSTRREVVATLRMPKAGYTHAFAMAEGHAIVWETAMRAQPLAFRFSARSYIDNFRWEPQGGSMLHAVSLADGSVRSWAIPAMMCFHAVQAHALGDEFVLELCTYDDATIFDDLRLEPLRSAKGQRAQPRLARYRLRRGCGDAAPEVFGGPFELPQVHPDRIGRGPARVAWGAAFDPAHPDTFLDRTVRLDLANGESRAWQRPNAVQLEPLFVPRPGGQTDDDGVLLVPTLADGDAATVIGVVDAHTMACEATLHAPQVIPFGFHAAFAA